MFHVRFVYDLRLSPLQIYLVTIVTNRGGDDEQIRRSDTFLLARFHRSDALPGSGETNRQPPFCAEHDASVRSGRTDGLTALPVRGRLQSRGEPGACRGVMFDICEYDNYS